MRTVSDTGFYSICDRYLCVCRASWAGYNLALGVVKDYGVIVREPVRDESGRVVEWDCIVFEHPVFSPLPENPEMEEGDPPTSGKPGNGDSHFRKNQNLEKPESGKPGHLQRTDFLQRNNINKTCASAWEEVLGLISNWREAKNRVSDPLISEAVIAIGGWQKLGSMNQSSIPYQRQVFISKYSEILKSGVAG